MTFLDWRDASHWATRPGRCRHCGGATQLLDDDGRYSHKVCAEQQADAAAGPGAA